jgi:hypothetical protein
MNRDDDRFVTVTPRLRVARTVMDQLLDAGVEVTETMIRELDSEAARSGQAMTVTTLDMTVTERPD